MTSELHIDRKYIRNTDELRMHTGYHNGAWTVGRPTLHIYVLLGRHLVDIAINQCWRQLTACQCSCWTFWTQL